MNKKMFALGENKYEPSKVEMTKTKTPNLRKWISTPPLDAYFIGQPIENTRSNSLVGELSLLGELADVRLYI